MLKKEITYTTFDGEKVTETLYFNLTKVEIAALQVKMDGKFIGYLQDLVKGNRVEALFHIFKDLVLDSYGERSDDGKRFIKSPEARHNFECSLAFSEMFVDMISNADKISDFTKSILPQDMVKAGELSAPAIAPVN